MTLMGCPLTVCILSALPRFNQPVLLDIDVDYFVTDRVGMPPPYYLKRPIRPWIGLPTFGRQLIKQHLPTDFVTICYSVNQGYTPLRDKYRGDHLRAWLARPSTSLRSEPQPASAAEAYRQFERAWQRWDDAAAAKAWRRIARIDSQYRTVFATQAYREETHHRGNLLRALKGYERLIRLDPEWPVAHFGRGRMLWRFRRWKEAEAEFRTAIDFCAGPTFASYWLGLCLERKGEPDQARRLWQKVLKQYPGNAMVCRALHQLDQQENLHPRRTVPVSSSQNSTDIRFERSPGIVTRKIMEEIILVPSQPQIREEAALFTLDATAAVLWDALVSPSTLPELSAALQDRYEVSPAQAESDVKVFLDQLTEAGLVRPASMTEAHAVR